MIEVVNGSLGTVQMPLVRDYDMRLTLASAIQQFPDLGESGFEFLELRGSQCT
jgi:hypothetical protein